MNEHQKSVVGECCELSAAGKIHFGEVVRRLVEAGIERYHADYSRGENTYYTPDGGSTVAPMPEVAGESAHSFSAEAVGAAVRGAQKGEVMYPEFVRLTKAAGCVGYFVQLTGRCVQYFGRNGEIHTEWFPGANLANP